MKQNERNEKGQFSKQQDLLGKRFNRLVVIDDKLPKEKYRKVKCSCDCGKEVSVILGHLNNGTTTSCGCYARDVNRRDKGHCGFTVVWNNSRAGARSRGLCWEITQEQLKELHKQPCIYCGVYLRSYMAPGDTQAAKDWAGYKYNGVDRVDSDKGYTMDNLVTCCIDCNRAKNDMSVEEFKAWLLRVYNHWASK